MRFWQKIFLLSLVLLMITISIVSLLLLRANHLANLTQARQNGLDTFDLIAGSIQTTLISDRYQAGGEFLSQEKIIDSLAVIAKKYIKPPFSSNLISSKSPAIYLELYYDSSEIFSTLPPENTFFQYKTSQEEADDKATKALQLITRPELQQTDAMQRNTLIRTNEQGDRWLFVAGNIELENKEYLLVTIQDVSFIYTQLNQQIKLFAELMLILALLAAGALLFLALYLTRPVALLRQYSSRFSRGEYSIRLKVKGKDELAALGNDFNLMAAAVEQNIHTLQRMNEERSRFIDNLTHEIKSPLTSIIGFADLLRQAKSVSDEERIRQATFIYNEGRQLEHISRLLMELTLMGQSDFDFETADIYDLLADTFSLFAPVEDKYKIKLVLTNEHGLVRVNKELFRSLITNLLENAAKASAPGSEIFLAAYKLPDSSVQMVIKDQGCGIPASEISKIIQPFYVLDKARTRKAGGAGLGLALCAQIVNIHGAKIDITSEEEKGTSVAVTFPPVIKP